jgi:hypothetical protein
MGRSSRNRGKMPASRSALPTFSQMTMMGFARVHSIAAVLVLCAVMTFTTGRNALAQGIATWTVVIPESFPDLSTRGALRRTGKGHALISDKDGILAALSERHGFPEPHP